MHLLLLQGPQLLDVHAAHDACATEQILQLAAAQLRITSGSLAGYDSRPAAHKIHDRESAQVMLCSATGAAMLLVQGVQLT